MRVGRPAVRKAHLFPRSEGLSFSGWSDAASGDQSSGGKCRLGYVVSLMSSTLNGPMPCSAMDFQFHLLGFRMQSLLNSEVNNYEVRRAGVDFGWYVRFPLPPMDIS